MSEEEQQAGISVHTGFPNPAADKSLSNLDLNQLLIQRTASTFLFRIRGDDWQDMGIFDNDIAIIDRALTPRASDLVVWWQDSGEQFVITMRRDVPASTPVWGVITSTIHQFRNRSA
jgi:SOS-response transcriptional repressor LexA